jgi:hypothetical protein
MARRRSGCAVLTIGLLFAVLGSFGVVGSWAVYRRDTAILQHGARVQGEISDKTLLSSADGDSDYIVEYSFVLPSGERIADQHGVSRRAWDGLDVGGAVEIAYDPAQPQQSFPVGSAASAGVAIWTATISAILGGFGWLLLGAAWRGRAAAEAPLTAGVEAAR